MNHADVRAKLADYLEGHLELTDRALLDAHLDACPECAADVAEMRATIAVLRGLPEPEVPGDFSANVMRRIRAGEGTPGFFDRVSNFFDDLLSPKVLAPASAALLSAGFVFWGQQVGLLDVGGATTTAQPAAQAEVAQASADRPARKAAADEDLQLVGFGAPAEAGRAAAGAPNPVFRVTISLEAAPPPYQLDPSMRTAPVPFRYDGFEPTPPQSIAVASNARSSAAEASLDAMHRQRVAADDGRFGIAAEDVREAPRSRDDWLAILESNPSEFAQQLSQLTLAEQEIWVDRLARHAAEQGSLDRVVERLRAAGGPMGAVLADDFAAVGRSGAQ